MNRTTLIGVSAAALFAMTGETAVASVMLTADDYPPPQQTFASFTYLVNFYQTIEFTFVDSVAVGELIPLEAGTIELQPQELIPPEPGYIDPIFQSFGEIPMQAFSSDVINYLSFAPASFDVTVQAVPAPAAVWLLGPGLAGFAAFGKRRQNR